MTTQPPVKVRVILGAANNVARISASETGCGAFTASSTSDGRRAAFCAAAKYFKLRPHECVSMQPKLTPLRLRLLQKGDVCEKRPEIYSAFLER